MRKTSPFVIRLSAEEARELSRVHRAKVFGRCEPTTAIAPFGRLIDQVYERATLNVSSSN